MPAPLLRALAQRAGCTMARAEHLWEQAKRIAQDDGRSEKDGDSYWAYTSGVLKKSLGLKETAMTDHLLRDNLAALRQAETAAGSTDTIVNEEELLPGVRLPGVAIVSPESTPPQPTLPGANVVQQEIVVDPLDTTLSDILDELDESCGETAANKNGKGDRVKLLKTLMRAVSGRVGANLAAAFVAGDRQRFGAGWNAVTRAMLAALPQDEQTASLEEAAGPLPSNIRKHKTGEYHVGLTHAGPFNITKEGRNYSAKHAFKMNQPEFKAKSLKEMSEHLHGHSTTELEKSRKRNASAAKRAAGQAERYNTPFKERFKDVHEAMLAHGWKDHKAGTIRTHVYEHPTGHKLHVKPNRSGTIAATIHHKAFGDFASGGQAKLAGRPAKHFVEQIAPLGRGKLFKSDHKEKAAEVVAAGFEDFEVEAATYKPRGTMIKGHSADGKTVHRVGNRANTAVLERHIMGQGFSTRTMPTTHGDDEVGGYKNPTTGEQIHVYRNNRNGQVSHIVHHAKGAKATKGEFPISKHGHGASKGGAAGSPNPAKSADLKDTMTAYGKNRARGKTTTNDAETKKLGEKIGRIRNSIRSKLKNKTDTAGAVEGAAGPFDVATVEVATDGSHHEPKAKVSVRAADGKLHPARVISRRGTAHVLEYNDGTQFKVNTRHHEVRAGHPALTKSKPKPTVKQQPKPDFEDDKKPTHTITPARYAKGQMLVQVHEDGSGFKTRGHRVAEDLKGRWSNRSKGYIMSPTKAAKFQQAMHAKQS